MGMVMKVDTWLEGETGAILSMASCSFGINNPAQKAWKAGRELLSMKGWEQWSVYALMAYSNNTTKSRDCERL